MRGTVAVVATAAVVLLGAAPAAPPESPVTFITVDELKVALDVLDEGLPGWIANGYPVEGANPGAVPEH